MPQALASKDAIRVHMRRVWLSTVPLTTVYVLLPVSKAVPFSRNSIVDASARSMLDPRRVVNWSSGPADWSTHQATRPPTAQAHTLCIQRSIYVPSLAASHGSACMAASVAMRPVSLTLRAETRSHTPTHATADTPVRVMACAHESWSP